MTTLMLATTLVALPADAKKPGHGKGKPAAHAPAKPGRGPAHARGPRKPARHVAKAAKVKKVKKAKKVAAPRRPARPRPKVVVAQPPAARTRAHARPRPAPSRRATRTRRARSASTAPRPPARSSTGAPAPVRPAARAPVPEPAAKRYVRVSEPIGDRAESTGPVPTVTKVIKRVPGWLWALLAAIAALCVAAFASSIVTGLRARRADRQRRAVMENVGLLQAALLPSVPAELAGVSLSVAYRPAEGLAAGGDFYDAVSLRDGRAGLIIGDVSGHGRTSLAQTALVRFTVRAYLEAGLAPRDALKLSQSALEDKLGDEFVTVMLAAFDPRTSTLTYAGAGHPPPLLRGGVPIPAVTAASAPLIGAGLGTGLRQTTVSLQADTTICLYTDGLTEAMLENRMLGRNKLTGLLDTLGDDATAERLLERVIEVSDRANDDMAVCVARVRSATGRNGAAFLMEELEVSRRDIGHGIVQRFLNACGVFGADVEEALARSRTLSEEFGAALLRVHRHEHPQRVEVAPLGVEGLVAPPGRS